MSERGPNGSVPAFADFLAYLRTQGFSIGLDHYVRLQELLEQIPPEQFERQLADDEDKRAQLSTLLCPLFATSQKQQEKFYAAFADYADLLQVAPRRLKQAAEQEEEDQELPVTKRPSRRWLYLGGAVLAVALVLAGVRVGVVPNPFPKPTPTPTPEETPTPTISPTVNPSPIPSLTVSTTAQVEVSPEVTQAPVPSVSQTPATVEEEGNAVSPPWKFYFLVGFGLLSVFLLWELFHFLARKLIVRGETARKPPATWPIRVEASTPELYDSEEFHKAARLMRRRQIAEYHRLDVNATIAATVANGGFPSFRYKPDSKAPEYLVLIDRASFRDHQAQLFNELVKAFEREGLFVARYFYEGDPRVCCDEKGEDCTHLSELQNQFAQHRLLLFGDGTRMIDPITGTMASWTSVFQEWQERAILTPEAEWGLREYSLSTQFVVLPASLNGLLALVDHFEAVVTIDPRLWAKNPLPTPAIDLDPGAAVAELRKNLGDQTFQWLCACAVYPELQWNLTLHLGSLASMGEHTITEENLLKLIRLPWFHTGSMTDDFRWPLINQLGDREPEVRAALIALLEKDPPPTGTFAADKYDLELALQRWRYHQDAESRDELRRAMLRLPPGQILQNQTLVRYLERVRNPVVDLVLPRRLRKYFFRNGVPWFGLRSSARLLITLLAMSLAFVAIRANLIHIPSILQPPVTVPTPTPDVNPSPSVSPVTGGSPSLSPNPTPAVSSSVSISPTPDVAINYGAGAKNLDTMLPVVADLARRLIATARQQGIEVMVTGTYISNEEQDKLYARGRTSPGPVVTNVRGGQSSHNKKIAFDIVPMVDGKPSYNDNEKFKKLGEIGRALGLTWGGDFSAYKDYPHFQYSPSGSGGATSSATPPRTSSSRSAASPTPTPTPTPDVTQPGPGPDNSEITQFFSRAGPRFTRTFRNSACPIESVEVQEVGNAGGHIISGGVVLRNGEQRNLPEAKWATAMKDSCADIAKAIGVIGHTQPAPTPTPIPTPPPKIISFEAAPTRVVLGQPVKLCYQVANAQSVKIDPDIGEVKSVEKGCVTVTPKADTTYTLQATGPDGKPTISQLDVRLIPKEDSQQSAIEAVSPDGKLIARVRNNKGTNRQNVGIYDAKTNRLIITLSGFTTPVVRIQFNRDMKTIAITSSDKVVRLWNLSTGKEIP